MTHPRSRRGAALEALALAAVFFLSFALFYRLTLRPSSDISIHATWAAEGNFADLTSFLHHGAHPMWHVLVALVLRLGVPLARAAALVTAACKTAEVWLIRRLMGRVLPDRSPAALTGLALCVGAVSSLLTPYNPTVYLGVGTPNTWHSPTQMIAMVWMLICVPFTARCYDRFEAALPDPRANIPWREGALLGALLLLSLTAKPTFMQALLPAAFVMYLVEVFRHKKEWRYFGQIVLAFLPSVGYFLLSYLYYTGVVVEFTSGVEVGITVETAWVAVRNTLMMSACPLMAVIVCYRKGMFKDRLVVLALLMTAFSVLEAMAFRETGMREGHGNFTWAANSSSFFLWVVMTGVFLRSFAQDMRLGALRSVRGLGYAAVGGLFLWHAYSSVYYLHYLLTSTNAF